MSETATTPLSPATLSKLWSVALPAAGCKMLADGIALPMVKSLYGVDPTAWQLEYDLIRAVTGTDRWARDAADVHNFCVNVVARCDEAELTYGQMWNIIPASAVKIGMSGNNISGMVGRDTWYVPGAHGGSDLHPSYELLSVMLPLTVWYMLDVPGQGEDDARGRHDYGKAREIAQRAAGAYAQLITFNCPG